MKSSSRVDLLHSQQSQERLEKNMQMPLSYKINQRQISIGSNTIANQVCMQRDKNALMEQLSGFNDIVERGQKLLKRNKAAASKAKKQMDLHPSITISADSVDEDNQFTTIDRDRDGQF